MMNNKQQFSPLAALGSGAICLTVFGGTMAPLFMGVLFNNGVVYESITDEGTEYTATYVHTLPPRPSPAPEPVEVEQEPQVPESPAKEEEALVDNSLEPVSGGEARDLSPAPEPGPEVPVEPEPEPEAIVDAQPEISEDSDRLDPDIFIEDVLDDDDDEDIEIDVEGPVTDMEEAVVEDEVEDPGCPGDTRVETLSSTMWYVHRELVEHYAHRPWQIKEIAGTWRSRDESGIPIGFKVRPTECSILFNAGFESNDIVTSINGRVVTSALEGIQAYFALRRDKIFDVRILRGGEEVALTFILEETEKEKARLARQEAREDRQEERRQRRANRRMRLSRDRGEAIVDAHEE
jgi:hypothetical protein